MSEPDPLQRARGAALRLLGPRPRTEAELRGRLLRTFDPPVVDAVVRRLIDESLIDDHSFAEQWVSAREFRNPRAAALVRRELVTRGVEPDLARHETAHMDEQENAYRAGLKLARRLNGVDAETFRRRLWAYLRRRAFDPSTCRATADRLWAEVVRKTEGAGAASPTPQ